MQRAEVEGFSARLGSTYISLLIGLDAGSIVIIILQAADGDLMSARHTNHPFYVWCVVTIRADRYLWQRIFWFFSWIYVGKLRA